MPAAIEVSASLRRKALAAGPTGVQWLTDLADAVALIERDWDLRVGSALAGGSGAYVAGATMADGTAAVLKLAIPDGLEGHSPFVRELEALELGAGHGYVPVLRADADRRAMLQERLGRPLDALGLPVEQQIEAIAATLRRAWRPVPGTVELRTGADQARYLEAFIASRWERLGRPCSGVTIDRALHFARERGNAFDAAAAVLIHGDAHPANVLEVPNGPAFPDGFALIDPDGMRSEPAHDLAIPLRDWSRELLARDAPTVALEWCAQLADRGGAPADAIWQWAFVERVSTGLFLLELGDPQGATFVAVAEHLTDLEP